MDVTRYRKIIEDSVREFALDFRKHALCYVYENDVQAFLYCKIRQKLEDQNLFEVDRNNIPLYSFTDPPKQDSLIRGRTSLLHCQTAIPSKPGTKQHFDIGFWNDVELEKKINHTDKKVSIAIEIKYHWNTKIRKKRGKGFLKILDSFLNDIDKMKKLDWGYGMWCLPNISEDELAALKGEICSRNIPLSQTVYLIGTVDYCGWKIEQSAFTKINRI